MCFGNITHNLYSLSESGEKKKDSICVTRNLKNIKKTFAFFKNVSVPEVFLHLYQNNPSMAIRVAYNNVHIPRDKVLQSNM